MAQAGPEHAAEYSTNISQPPLHVARGMPAAPYVPYRTFKDFLVRISKAGIPEQIEPNIDGVVSLNSANHMIASLRFLRLIDAHRQPTAALHELAGSLGTDRWATTLELTMRNAYPTMFQIDLATVLPPDFIAGFKRGYGGSESVLRKSRTFFLHAAQDAGLRLHAATVRTTKPRGTRKQMAPAVQSPRRIPPRPASMAPVPAPYARKDPSPPGLSERLLSQVDTRGLRPTEQRAFWVVLKLLKDRGL